MFRSVEYLYELVHNLTSTTTLILLLYGPKIHLLCVYKVHPKGTILAHCF